WGRIMAMPPVQALLARKSLDKRLPRLREEPMPMPRAGWIKAIREALGLTAQQLASRMGVVQSRVSTIEKAEITGATTVKTLRATAEAMGCTFVYAIVPTKPLEADEREALIPS
uniref:helix-turn-helix domain-containing protein n=1 Tax=Aquidulcibacter sp. TaxID=2052990 RepID=UPI0028A95AA5